MFGWELPPYNSGGLGVASYELAKALTDKDVDITFVLPQQVDVQAPFLHLRFPKRSDRLKIHPIDSLLSPYITSDEYAKRKYLMSNRYAPELFSEVERYAETSAPIVKKEDFEIIHAHDWLTFPAGMKTKRATGKPLVTHVHSTEFDRAGGPNGDERIYQIERQGLEYSDKIIAVSKYTKTILVDKYKIPERKIDIIYNAIGSTHVTKLKSPLSALKANGRKIVLFVGRITLQKGPDYFVQVAHVVTSQYPKALFVIAGSGDMEEQVISQAAHLGLSDRIIFAGFLRGEELAALYQTADIFVLPSVSEPFGIAPLEAIANGTPVILSSHSGVSEVLPHAPVVDIWNTDRISSIIINMLKSQSLKNSILRWELYDTKELSWNKSADRCYKTYKQVLKTRQ